MGTNPRDFQEKLRRIRAYLEREGFAAMLLARRDSFAWATLGGDNKVLRDTPVGAAVLLCTRDRVYLVAQSMDADRILDDELAGLPVEPVTLRWYDPPPAAYAASLAGGPVVSDTEAPGCEARPAALRALHLPYTPWEVQRFEAAGAFFDETFLAAAEALAPGMTERAAAALPASRRPAPCPRCCWWAATSASPGTAIRCPPESPWSGRCCSTWWPRTAASAAPSPAW